MSDVAIEQFNQILTENPAKLRSILTKYGINVETPDPGILASAILLFGDPFIADLYTLVMPAELANYTGEDDDPPETTDAVNDAKTSGWQKFADWIKPAANDILKTFTQTAANRIINGKPQSNNSGGGNPGGGGDKPKNDDNSTKYLMWGLGALALLILAVAILAGNRPSYKPA